MGTWKELRKELAGEEEEPDYTIREFANVYFEEYCKIRNTRPDFKEERLKTIKDIVGDLKLREFTSAHAAYFEKERAKGVNPRTGKPIAKATINRGLAVLSHMFTFALKKRLIVAHPMTRYGRLREDEKALRVITLEEERRLVERVMDENLTIGCYIGLLGETGLRKAEGLKLKWDYVDSERRTVTVEASKNGKTSVQGLLGHRNIKTTERYVKFVPGHASKRVIEAQRSEDLEMANFHRRQIGDINESKLDVSVTH